MARPDLPVHYVLYFYLAWFVFRTVVPRLDRVDESEDQRDRFNRPIR